MPRGKPANAAPKRELPGGTSEIERDYSREKAVRRLAARQGYRAVKARRYDTTYPDWGTWFLYQGSRRVAELPVHKVRGILVGASLDELEKFLSPDGDNGQDQAAE